MRYWFLLYPDTREPVGGVKQMHRLAECFAALGRTTCIVQDDASFHPGWFQSSVNTISLTHWTQLLNSRLKPGLDVIVIPETFLHEIAEYSKYFPIVIFCQNCSYSFGSQSKNIYNPSHIFRLYHHPNVKQILCVSNYDRQLLSDYFRLGSSKVSLIVNGLEEHLFDNSSPKKNKIVYLQRKNLVDVAAVTGLLKLQPWFQSWELVKLKKVSHSAVINEFSESLIYLSFGHPEGFGLPVAEAMASGCIVVGYSGLGGRELFQLTSSLTTSKEVDIGDWPGFISALHDFHLSVQTNRALLLEKLRQASKLILRNYNSTNMRNSACKSLEKIEHSISGSPANE